MKTEYFRSNHIIADTDGNIVFTGLHHKGTPFEGPSINAAKRESRRLQGSALGQGMVQVLSD
jgi:hypothetical protein